MSSTLHLPQAEEIGKFLTNLFGLGITAKEAGAIDSSKIIAVADYVDDAGSVRAVMACDLPCAAKLGAALTQIPMGAVEDTLESRSLPDNLAENLGEVFNIGVNIFPECYAQRLVVQNVTVNAEAPAAFAAACEGKEVKSYTVDIQRYGSGTFAIAIS
jgi:hypothetical protein